MVLPGPFSPGVLDNLWALCKPTFLSALHRAQRSPRKGPPLDGLDTTPFFSAHCTKHAFERRLANFPRFLGVMQVRLEPLTWNLPLKGKYL